MHERGSDYKADFHKYIFIKRWVKTFHSFGLFWDSHDDNLVLFLNSVCKNSHICFRCNNVWVSLFQMRCRVKNWFTIDNPTSATPPFCPFSQWTSIATISTLWRAIRCLRNGHLDIRDYFSTSSLVATITISCHYGVFAQDSVTVATLFVSKSVWSIMYIIHKIENYWPFSSFYLYVDRMGRL